MIEIKNEYVIECGGCGVKFLTSNKNRKYCSNACKAKAYRQRKQPKLDRLIQQLKNRNGN